MPVSIQELIADTITDQTVLVFGAGASLPSGAPSVAALIEHVGDRFHIANRSLSLAEISALAERKRSRRELIGAIREKFVGLRPKESLLNLPLYDWKGIFTTNYDDLVEQAYARSGRAINVVSSNFDFQINADPLAQKLFKIHGSIEKDTTDGHKAGLILTTGDYDATQDYRQALFDRLKADIGTGAQVLIVGQSLVDTDLKDVIERAIAINQRAMSGGRISLLLYEFDKERAELFEMRGLKVAFGGIDQLFAELAKKTPSHKANFANTGSPLDLIPSLRPITVDVAEQLDSHLANSNAIFNGWPANYADVQRGLTFDRVVAEDVARFLQGTDTIVAVILGASGVGKTTAARQAVMRLRAAGFLSWEHKPDHHLSPKNWLALAQSLQKSDSRAVLLVDDAHSHLFQVNELVESLASAPEQRLRLILTSTRNHWGPRVKSPSVFSRGKDFPLSQLSSLEINRLLTLVETVPELVKLVEAGFGGFNRTEKRRRLAERCEADMFVCMRNIFASEKYDDIILREFGTLDANDQEIYKLVSAMENGGIRVHRQLVMRVLGVKANHISSILGALEDIVSEYPISAKDGIYGWRVRHGVIAAIVAKYKFSDVDKVVALFESVIANIQPTYDIEIRTIQELCNTESGISVIPNKNTQNRLLRQMMSVAPGERIPRHRLIRNLIDMGELEQAETEIRIFVKDFGKDGPVARYRILLMIGRAKDTPGLLLEDRIAILEQAREYASSAAQRYENNKNVLSAYCEVGLEIFKLTASTVAFDASITALKKAENRMADPDISRILAKYQQRVWGK